MNIEIKPRPSNQRLIEEIDVEPIHINTDHHDLSSIFNTEIHKAITWLLDIQDSEQHGWGWLQHIPPNEQNTAEVICALLSQDISFDKDIINRIVLAINEFILTPTPRAKITIDYVWVLRALIFIEKKIDMFKGAFNLNSVYKVMETCIHWLSINQNEDGGWGDYKGDFSSVSRTSLVLMNIAAFNNRNDERQILTIPEMIRSGENWLLEQRDRSTNAWGNISEENISKHYEEFRVISSDKVEYQHLPNPSCTGYAILALYSINPFKYKKVIENASHWLLKTQGENGGWPVFFEIGYRDGKLFTFRHFSTVWVVTALLESRVIDFQDDAILDALDYILTLQDPICGGWGTSNDTDPFTWATCNVLELLNKLKLDTQNISTSKYISILKEWRNLKIEKEVVSLRYKKWIISFNPLMSLLFGSSLTLLTVALLVIVIMLDLHNTYYLKILFTILFSFLLCLPWIFHMRYGSKKEISWLEAIAYVTGPLLGLLGLTFGYIFN